MFDFFEKILIGLLVMCVVILFACYVVIFYKAATNDENFFAHKVYTVNKYFCREAE